MLTLDNYKVVFLSVGLIGTLLFASPTLSMIWHWPSGETFSEIWLLGPEQTAEGYPHNVKADENYSVYIGVGNHLGSSAYYEVYVKFRNQSEPLPNATSRTPSPLPPLYKYRLFLQDGKNSETPLAFSFSKVYFSENQSLIKRLTINNVTSNIEKSALWDAKNKGYYYQLFLELWIYNVEPAAIQYHNRFLRLTVNMTG